MAPPVPFQVLRKLEDTPVAEVFLAEGAAGRQVEVTVIRPEWSEPSERLERMLQESAQLEAVRHPGLVECLGGGHLADARGYVVTEHLFAPTLRACLQEQGPLSPAQVRTLGLRMAEALAAAHGAGLLHRGLCPERVKLPEGLGRLQPRLMDFASGLFEGTQRAAYVPPERWTGEDADLAGDIYGLGALLFEALTGRPPPSAAPSGDGTGPAARPELPESAGPLGPIVLRCLEPLAKDRFASAADVAIALEYAARASARDVTVLPAAPPPSGYPPVHEPLRTLGSYELQGLLGEGSMGQVYLARHARLGKEVAIKVLKPEHAKNQGLLERFFVEARTVNQINHEHIVEVHDFVREVGPDGATRAYCVMERLTGKTLGQLLEAGPLTVARILRIARQVCAGLGAAHKLGVVHRDVKPDNIFITERSGVTDYVKLLDFGVAKLMTSAVIDHEGTQAGTILGTPDYMSPEQAAGIAVDARSDVYSLGVVLYELLSFRRPFSAPAFGQLVVDINTKPPPPLPPKTPLGEDIPRLVAQAVMHCLEKDPGQRPQSMDALRRELDRALSPSLETLTAAPAALQVLPPVAPPTVPPTPGGDEDSLEEMVERLRPRHGRQLLFALAAVALSAVLALGVWRALHPRPAPDVLVAKAPTSPQPESDAPELPKLVSSPAPEVAPVPKPSLPPPQRSSVGATARTAALPVKLRVRSVPPGALVERLDTGQRLGWTPVVQSVTRMDAPLRVRVSLAGHRPIEKTVHLSEDVALEVELQPNRALATARTKVKAKPHAKEGKTGVSRDGVIDPYASGP